ncbi:polysaccharide deacetylase family protein [Aquimarina pacifica]|uniref:polysaccharide deacetylase family protein n=1 Tax=Aquimarina pacifica TaxID=1296415 RepID=UPI00046F05EF|nr:polysaccharide deacetylase family protein [Aquimarina pacifica]
MIIPTKTPAILKWLFSGFLWDIKNGSSHNKIFLTFDDGPIPGVTEFVLDLLEEYNAKATFFCIGDNIRKHPTIFDRILDEGHAIGNHTMNHLKAWKTNNKDYIQNVIECQNAIDKRIKDKNAPLLFRPPYGQISFGKTRILKRMGYTIVLWDVLSKDWKQEIKPQKCLQNVLSKAQSGSVIVFHDSIKSSEKLQFALPEVLKYYTEKGFSFEKIAS